MTDNLALSRPHRDKERLVKKILKAIPYDDWVSSREIADRIGVEPRRVGHLIRHRLLHVYVERKPMELEPLRGYVYRRLRRVGEGLASANVLNPKNVVSHNYHLEINQQA